MIITLYKRNAKGEPIFWSVEKTLEDRIAVCHGIVEKSSHSENISTLRNVDDEIKTMINTKRKQGYKELKDLYDNAPEKLPEQSISSYLNLYLPKFNTHADGKFIPMLCKTLEDNKPFEKGIYSGQWKINGERCIVTAEKSDDLFSTVKLHYRSREGIDWTDKLSFMDDHILQCIKGDILDMMIEENVALDGEMYVPGFGINEVNSFIKNPDVPQHRLLQYWVYDLCIEGVSAKTRYVYLYNSLKQFIPIIKTKDKHLTNLNQFVLLPTVQIQDINDAINKRDEFISLGFEGLVIREQSAEYQFGGKRNNSMLKFKRKLDGYFEIVDIREDKRGLPIFTLKNDVNDELFSATLNTTQDKQRFYLTIKDIVIGKKALVEYRERSGQKAVPFHAKMIKIDIDINIH